MLTLILSTLGTLLPIVLQNTGVLGSNGALLTSTLTGLGLTLYGKIKAGATATEDVLAGLATLKGALEALKATTGLSADVLTQIEGLDGDITAALIGYATAQKGYDPAAYGQIAPVA